MSLILYRNLQGMSSYKLNQITNHYLPTCDLFFAAETWHLDRQQVIAHPLTVAYTPLDQQFNSRSNTRAQGGLACLSRYECTTLQITPFSITVKTRNALVVTALYLPPSLKADYISTLLRNLPKSDVIVGDINVRFGSKFNDISTNPQRRVIMMDFFEQHGYQHPTPSTGTTTTDHVFHNGKVQSWHITEDNIVASDHKLMTLQMDNNPPPAIERNTTSTRYYISKLKDNRVRNQLTIHFNNLAANYTNTYDDIIRIIQQTAMDVLGSYTPSSTPPTTISYRHIKKHLNNNKQNILISTNEAVIQHFKGIYQTLDPPTRDQIDCANDTEFEKYFSANHISDFFNRYPKQRSPGHDGLHARILDALLESRLPTMLEECFIKIIRTGIIPESWKLSSTFPLAKSSTSTSIEEFRPVALTVMNRRCFEALTLRAINGMESCRTLRTFNYAQTGFVAKHGCIQSLLIGQEIHDRGFSTSVYIDLEKAYDRVNLNLLTADLYRRHTPPVLIRLIQDLFMGCKTRVVVNGKLTDTISLHTGLFQGSILSPFLWNVYMDDLANALNGPLRPFPRAIFFADDIRLFFKRSEVHLIQAQLDMISNWCTAKNMKPSNAKCGVSSQMDINVTINNGPIPQVELYKYLGIEHNIHGIDFDSYYTRIIAKTTRLIHLLDSIKFPLLLRLKVAKTMVLPILEYGLPLYWGYLERQALCHRSRHGQTNIAALDQVLQVLLAWVFNKDNTCKTMYSMAGILLIKDRMEMLATSFCNHLQQVPTTSLYFQLSGLLSMPSINSVTSQFKFRNTMYQKFQKQDKSIYTYLKQFKLDRLSSYGTLASYINGRSPGGTDRVLFISNPQDRYLAIQFRLNRLFHQGTCLTCHLGFTRRCLAHGSREPVHATELDSLLDTGQIEEFKNMLATYMD